MKKLRCFVAMAFDWPDTDDLFNAIKAMPSATYDVRRVDRINHNNDIDDKILEELNAADFVVADLTYARQSVYFEAGYAQGNGKPVVYTARRDHVGQKAVDDARRVHFDLQMRNIITWTTPTDGTFATRLRARLRLVTAPLRADRAEAEAREGRRRAFATGHRCVACDSLLSPRQVPVRIPPPPK